MKECVFGMNELFNLFKNFKVNDNDNQMGGVILYGTGATLDGWLFEIEFAFEMFKNKNSIDNSLMFKDLIYMVVDDTKIEKEISIEGKNFVIKNPKSIKYLSEEQKTNSIVLITAGRYARHIATLLQSPDFPANMKYADLNALSFNLETWNKKLIRFLMKNWVKEYDYFDIPRLTKTLYSWMEKDQCIMPFIDIKLTQKCTLNCRHCSSLMSSLKRKNIDKHQELDMILKDIEILDRNCLYIGTVALSTGEVLAYPHLKEVLDVLVNNEKIHEVTIITNATVLPAGSVIPLLKNRKVSLYISDYRNIVQMAKVVEFYEKNDIDFEIFTGLQWKAMESYPVRQNLDSAELVKRFNDCGIINLCPPGIRNGKIFACGFTDIFQNLGECVSSKDYIDVSNCTATEFKKMFYELLDIDYLDSCDMCPYANGGDRFVDAGVQIDEKKRWHRSNYMIVKRN